MYISSMLAVIPLHLALTFWSLLQAQPQDPQVTFRQVVTEADDARNAGRLNEAIGLYTQGVRRHPAWHEGWWWLASLLYEQDRFSEAQAAFAQFVKLDPHPGPGYAFLALCEYETRYYDRALQHFQAWSKYGSPGNDDLLDVAGYHWALLLTRKAQFSEALYLLAAKAKKLGATPTLVEAMGLASLRIASLPEDYPPENRELVWLAGSAALYGTRDDVDRSKEFAHRLAVRYAHEANVHYFLGTLLGFQGKLREAAEEFKGELQINPRPVPTWIDLALVYVGDFQPAEAVPLARLAVTLDPNNARARYALGKSLLDTDRFTE